MTRRFVRRGTGSAGGQVLVVVGLAMVALLAMLALVIDVGFAWAANRDTQNGVDATANAGAIVLVQYMAGSTPAKTDADVRAAVDAAAAANELTLDYVEYTDFEGDPFVPSLEVGAQPGGGIPAGAQGVRATASYVHETILAEIIGIGELTVHAEGTAVGGPPTEPCEATDGCALLPITFPTTVVTCDGQNKSVPTTDDWQNNTVYTIPLCGNNPGSVGWLDWYPPAGGASELDEEICNPNPPPLDLPDWFEVTSTGNVNSQDVEDCLNQYAGQRILLPMFDDTCREDPGEGNPCTNPAEAGQNQWYHFPAFAVFELDYPKGAYVNGNNSADCEQGNNGATSCLKGRFVDAVAGGTVGEWDPTAPQGPGQMWAVQLIR